MTFVSCSCILSYVLSDRETVELFHLQFVRALGAGPDKAKYAIKGGCNLRFYFGSIRYSEDLDLDVRFIGQAQNLVRSVCRASGVVFPTRARGRIWLTSGMERHATPGC